MGGGRENPSSGEGSKDAGGADGVFGEHAGGISHLNPRNTFSSQGVSCLFSLVTCFQIYPRNPVMGLFCFCFPAHRLFSETEMWTTAVPVFRTSLCFGLKLNACMFTQRKSHWAQQSFVLRKEM